MTGPLGKNVSNIGTYRQLQVAPYERSLKVPKTANFSKSWKPRINKLPTPWPHIVFQLLPFSILRDISNIHATPIIRNTWLRHGTQVRWNEWDKSWTQMNQLRIGDIVIHNDFTNLLMHKAEGLRVMPPASTIFQCVESGWEVEENTISDSTNSYVTLTFLFLPGVLCIQAMGAAWRGFFCSVCGACHVWSMPIPLKTCQLGLEARLQPCHILPANPAVCEELDFWKSGAIQSSFVISSWLMQCLFLGKKTSHTWNPKHPFINGCFNWMIPNLYIGNGCFTKHPFLTGCLGFQVRHHKAEKHSHCKITIRSSNRWKNHPTFDPRTQSIQIHPAVKHWLIGCLMGCHRWCKIPATWPLHDGRDL